MCFDGSFQCSEVVCSQHQLGLVGFQRASSDGLFDSVEPALFVHPRLEEKFVEISFQKMLIGSQEC